MNRKICGAVLSSLVAVGSIAITAQSASAQYGPNPWENYQKEVRYMQKMGLDRFILPPAAGAGYSPYGVNPYAAGYNPYGYNPYANYNPNLYTGLQVNPWF